VELTDRWTSAGPAGPGPWCFRGKLLHEQGRESAAAAAFQEALRLTALGDEAASRGAQSQLAALDVALATRLRVEVQRLPARR
jgi:hypothetical protein